METSQNLLNLDSYGQAPFSTRTVINSNLSLIMKLSPVHQVKEAVAEWVGGYNVPMSRDFKCRFCQWRILLEQRSLN